MEELHNHTQNAEKFKGVLDEDASIYQKREVKSGREQMAELHGKDKWIFFRDYYSKKLLVIVLVIVVVIQFIYNYLTTADYALNILAINATGEGNEEFEASYFTEFLEENEIDTSRYEASVNRSITVDTSSSDSFSAYSVE
ncbi:MAG: hypothetical protein LIO94_05560, partial [Clostridiales bacterium]|nr:hypothetical protein [Clostridiales bacterium]